MYESHSSARDKTIFINFASLGPIGLNYFVDACFFVAFVALGSECRTGLFGAV